MNNKELTRAYRLRHALDESSQHVSPAVRERLASARQIAMSRKKAESAVPVLVPQLAGMPSSMPSFRLPSLGNSFEWLGRITTLIPLAALVFGLSGLYQYEERQQILELANIDAEVLTDDLPLSAYLDHGFDAFLAKEAD